MAGRPSRMSVGRIPRVGGEWGRAEMNQTPDRSPLLFIVIQNVIEYMINFSRIVAGG